MRADRTVDVGRAFQRLAAVCQSRGTTTARLLEALRSRRGLRHRDLLLELLDDLAAGACSVLEREYLRRVERAHGLPGSERQVRSGADGKSVYRDATYVAHAFVVELDGRAFHDDPLSRDLDAERDLEAAVDQHLQTVRLTYRQVLDRGCGTARAIGRLLNERGWDGAVTACPDCCDS